MEVECDGVSRVNVKACEGELRSSQRPWRLSTVELQLNGLTMVLRYGEREERWGRKRLAWSLKRLLRASATQSSLSSVKTRELLFAGRRFVYFGNSIILGVCCLKFLEYYWPTGKTSCSLVAIRKMGLWTLLEGCLLLANALAILNEDRFLAPRGWSFQEYSGVTRNSFKGQILGLIYATQYLRVPLILLNLLCIVVKLVSG
ncbi:Yos1-like protein [Striga hermonthica]|uniref:Yos1-like protein n=2 Tax=Lamiales TaxID=4143 RepID=A0A9N7NGC3_STRHE|nr:Yos1-like protein [Striga hermonthica]